MIYLCALYIQILMGYMLLNIAMAVLLEEFTSASDRQREEVSANVRVRGFARSRALVCLRES